MKNIILISLFLTINSSVNQGKGNGTTDKTKEDTTEYFDVENYRDWEIYTDYLPSENNKFLKKGDERIQIYFNDNDGIQLRVKNTRTPYETVKGFSNKTKKSSIIGDYFFDFSIGIDKEYDETGKVIREKDYYKPCKFSLKEVIEKVKKEYQIDLEDKAQRGLLQRGESDKLNNMPIYEVYMRATKENKDGVNYVLIDGITGGALFKTLLYMDNMENLKILPPLDQYLETLKKNEKELFRNV